VKFHVENLNEKSVKNQIFITMEQKYPALYKKTAVFFIFLQWHT